MATKNAPVTMQTTRTCGLAQAEFRWTRARARARARTRARHFVAF